VCIICFWIPYTFHFITGVSLSYCVANLNRGRFQAAIQGARTDRQEEVVDFCPILTQLSWIFYVPSHSTLFFFSMALPAHSAPWPLIQFRNHVSHPVELLGRVISSSQGHNLTTGQHKHWINVYTNIHTLSGFRTHDPSVRSSEDSSCLRPRGYCGRPLDIIATQIG
jgi:hypothetical protein